MAHSHLWQTTADRPEIPSLNREIEVDVCVVGAGITGLTLARELGRTGLEVAVVEATAIGGGTTGHTSAHLTWMPDRSLHDLAGKVGRERLATLIAAQQQAIDHIERTSDELGLDARVTRVPGWRFAEPHQRDDLDRELAELDALGIPATITTDAPLPFPIARALRIDRQAMFHPLRYLYGLARHLPASVQVFGDSRVVDWSESGGPVVRTEHGVVRARELVFATHTPPGRMLRVQARVAPYVSWVLVLRLERPLTPGLYWDTADPYHYHRPSSTDPNLAIVGGFDHRPGNRDSSDVIAEFEQWARRRFPVVERVDAWAHEVFEPTDGLPYVGAAPGTGHTWVATGYAGNGLTLGTAAALQLAEQIQGRPYPSADAFSPSRLEPLRTAPHFLRENLENALHFFGDRLRPGGDHDLSTLRPGEGRVIREGGHKLAIYRDDAGALHALSPVCTHMGCIVGWNGAERTWDCPCHGGRYDPDGEPVYGPPLAPLARRSLPGREEP